MFLYIPVEQLTKSEVWTLHYAAVAATKTTNRPFRLRRVCSRTRAPSIFSNQGVQIFQINFEIIDKCSLINSNMYRVNRRVENYVSFSSVESRKYKGGEFSACRKKASLNLVGLDGKCAIRKVE